MDSKTSSAEWFTEFTAYLAGRCDGSGTDPYDILSPGDLIQAFGDAARAEGWDAYLAGRDYWAWRTTGGDAGPGFVSAESRAQVRAVYADWKRYGQDGEL